VDHSTLKEVTPDGALLLISQFDRVTSYSKGAKLWGLFKGMPEDVVGLLKPIGYFKYFPNIQMSSKPPESMSIVEHTTGRTIDPRAADSIITEFKKSNSIDDVGGKRLGKCLIECMENVSKHAYDYPVERRLLKKWWMIGYRDTLTGELSFVFLDQGIGMPKKLRFSRADQLIDFFGLNNLFGVSDEELIIAAFLRPMSSTKKSNRGLGLTGLKRYLDRGQKGELLVQSHSSRVLLKPGARPTGMLTKKKLEGTMLLWKFLPRKQVQI